MLRAVRDSRFFPFALVLVLLVAACSSSSETASSPTPVATSSPTPPKASPTATVVNDCTIEPKAQCPGAQLSLVSLMGQDLSGANLEGADLSTSDLRKVDFTGANLIDATVSESDLTDADLTGADLTGAKLKNANLTRTDFTGATVSTGQLASAYMCGTIMPNGGKNNSGCTVPTQSPASSGSPTPSGPTITSFVAPDGSPPCPASPPDATVEVRIRYKTTGANSVSFTADGEAVSGVFDTSGAANLTFSCDKPSHRYTMTASGNGGKVKQSATVYRT
jgi:hypothetical protein